MSSQRTRTIQSLERLHREVNALIAKAIVVNQLIYLDSLDIPPLDLADVHRTQTAIEERIAHIEVRAGATA